ncbi:hypothetical protein [uncultured Bradyrhizobium sp.]|uniref:hypothetical protein n=1 Tax=uncultured Bradyrhizobium sp. TaxID=199684 RepID=UPI0026374E35|nr:hypothetical protein [uncultured Bradyrhizobium sp.]
MRKVSRARAKCVSAEASANPVLLYIALSLLTVLGIVEADLHRDTLKQLGIVINSELIDSRCEPAVQVAQRALSKHGEESKRV